MGPAKSIVIIIKPEYFFFSEELCIRYSYSYAKNLNQKTDYAYGYEYAYDNKPEEEFSVPTIKTDKSNLYNSYEE